jgi:hypothetical protein
MAIWVESTPRTTAVSSCHHDGPIRAKAVQAAAKAPSVRTNLAT